MQCVCPIGLRAGVRVVQLPTRNTRYGSSLYLILFYWSYQITSVLGHTIFLDSDLAQSLYFHAGMNIVVIMFMYCVLDIDNVVALYCLLGLAFLSHAAFFIVVRI
jgi:hypothetical protein